MYATHMQCACNMHATYMHAARNIHATCMQVCLEPCMQPCIHYACNMHATCIAIQSEEESDDEADEDLETFTERMKELPITELRKACRLLKLSDKGGKLEMIAVLHAHAQQTASDGEARRMHGPMAEGRQTTAPTAPTAPHASRMAGCPWPIADRPWPIAYG